jgi:hypothetical protein
MELGQFEKPAVAQLLKNFPNILWNPEPYFCVLVNLPLLPILSQ